MMRSARQAAWTDVVPQPQCYVDRNGLVKKKPSYVTDEHASLGGVARSKPAKKRVKLAIPADWIDEVRKKLAGPPEVPDRELARRLRPMGNSTVHRFWHGDASWDTVLKIAREVGIEPLVNPYSAAGQLEIDRRSRPDIYTEKLERLAGARSAPSSSPSPTRGRANSGDSPR